jgi:hypothetical protein
MNILLVNFGAFGDILNSTPIAKHFKLENPANHITWMTRQKYITSIKNNPHIDRILTPKEEHLGLDNQAEDKNVYMTSILKKEIANLNYDKIFFLAPYVWTSAKKDINLLDYSLLYIIKNKLTDIQNFLCEFIPVVVLSEEEKNEAKTFFSRLTGDKKFLIEYESFSNQTPFGKNHVIKLCEAFNGKNYDFIFSGKHPPDYIESLKKDYNINFHFYEGSFMSNAELFNLCDYFVGCCSGLTCLTHSDYCDSMKPRIEVVYGYHWSSADWKHASNKAIVCSVPQFAEALGAFK